MRVSGQFRVRYSSSSTLPWNREEFRRLGTPNYEQYLLTFKLYHPDFLVFVCEFQASSKFYKIVQVPLNKIKRSSGSSELVIGYIQFSVLFQIVNHDLLGLAWESRVILEFDIVVLVLLHEIETSSGVWELLINYKQYLLTFKLYNPDLLGFACEFQVSPKFYKIV